ncbi:hypothetical protein BKA83DRAFT_4047631, partial [Pisolithus microcarpus]
QKNFVKEFAMWYSELSCLPYFDLVQQIVIDPMHNLFLGLVKTHFYNIWVQSKILRPNYELTTFHNMLSDFIIPSSCGKLLMDIGIPASGSLTANQWLLLATIYGPIVVKALTHRLVVVEKAETQKQLEVAPKANNKASLAEAKKQGKEAYEAEQSRIVQENLAMAEAKKNEKLQQVVAKQAEKVQQANVKKVTGWLSLHPDDPANFLKLSMAIRILLYGTGIIKPNHHYATHVADCTCNFGPLHDFWTFLFERLNKVLKSFKANNHSNGELETTFFKEFHRTCETSRLVSIIIPIVGHLIHYNTTDIRPTY